MASHNFTFNSSARPKFCHRLNSASNLGPKGLKWQIFGRLIAKNPVSVDHCVILFRTKCKIVVNIASVANVDPLTCYLHCAPHGEQDVVRLNVPVHHVPLMEIVQPLQHLSAHSRHLVGAKFITGWSIWSRRTSNQMDHPVF